MTVIATTPAEAPRGRRSGSRATRRIVVATDGSAGGREAVQAGLELARAARAIATIVHVRHAPLPFVGDPFYQRALSAEVRAARDVVDDATAQAAQADVEVESEILEGDPATEILRVARQRDAALIVVGSRGLGRIAGALVGSVSSAIVRRADRPVLVVKPRVATRQPAA